MSRKHSESLSQLNKILPIPIQLESPAEYEQSKQKTNKLGNITNVIVGDHHLIAGDNGGPSFTVWCIKIIINDLNYGLIVVYKRYSEIEELHKVLRKKFPNVPDMPPKDSMNFLRLIGNEDWIEQRRKGLQWLLSNILLNPRMVENEVVRGFIFEHRERRGA